MLHIILSTIVIYLLGGIVFAIAFLLKGITVADDAAKGASMGFHIIILPGVITLWPFLLGKWITKSKLMNQARIKNK